MIKNNDFSDIFYKDPIDFPEEKYPQQNTEQYTPENSPEIYKKEYVEALIQQNTYLQEKIFELEAEVDNYRYSH